MVRYTIIEPERYGFFNDEYVVVQIFPPLDHMTPVRQGDTITVYWGIQPLCKYKDPEWHLQGTDQREFMKRPALTGYLWFRFDDEEKEEYAMSLIRQAVANAKSCIKGRRMIQPVGERFTVTVLARKEGYARPEPAIKKVHKPAPQVIPPAGKPVSSTAHHGSKPVPSSKEVKPPAEKEKLSSPQVKSEPSTGGAAAKPSTSAPSEGEKPARKPSASPQEGAEKKRTCEVCGRPLRFIEKYSRWYCDACKKYAHVEEKKGTPAGENTAGEKEKPEGH